MLNGERSLLPAFPQNQLQTDPLGTLIDAYFNKMPDVFHRPNTRLYDWLRPRLLERRIRGLILWRYPWCDLWHAELAPLREAFGLPVLDLDAGDTPQLAPPSRTASKPSSKCWPHEHAAAPVDSRPVGRSL